MLRYLPHNVTAFNLNSLLFNTHDITYKTVNIYIFSRQTWERVSKCLDNFISDGKVNDYYETVFAEMIADGNLNFQSILFAKERWSEIDTVEDLHACERRFSNNSNQHHSIIQYLTNYGGYAFQ